jgi:hypothetical protein
MIAAPPSRARSLQPDLAKALRFFRRSRGRRDRSHVGDRCGREGRRLWGGAWHRRRDCGRRIRRETLGNTLNDDLDEWSLEDGYGVRHARSPGGQDRDGEAGAREQYHPAEGEKDLREAARPRPSWNRRGLFVVAPFGWSIHGGTRSAEKRRATRKTSLPAQLVELDRQSSTFLDARDPHDRNALVDGRFQSTTLPAPTVGARRRSCARSPRQDRSRMGPDTVGATCLLRLLAVLKSGV